MNSELGIRRYGFHGLFYEYNEGYYKISDSKSHCDVWVVKSQEDFMLAKHGYDVLSQATHF